MLPIEIGDTFKWVVMLSSILQVKFFFARVPTLHFTTLTTFRCDEVCELFSIQARYLRIASCAVILYQPTELNFSFPDIIAAALWNFVCG